MTDFLGFLLMTKWADHHQLEVTEKYSCREKNKLLYIMSIEPDLHSGVSGVGR